MNQMKPLTKSQQFFRETRDYLMIALGMLMYGVGWTVFLLPNDIPSGAVPGIASIVFWATGFPVQYTYLIINFSLLLLALKILGLKFCLKTIWAVAVLTILLAIIQDLIKGSLIHDQPFMACVNTGTTAISNTDTATAVTCATAGTDTGTTGGANTTAGICTRIDTAKKSDTGTTAGKRKNGKCMCIERRSAWKKRLCNTKKLQNYIG